MLQVADHILWKGLCVNETRYWLKLDYISVLNVDLITDTWDYTRFVFPREPFLRNINLPFGLKDGITIRHETEKSTRFRNRNLQAMLIFTQSRNADININKLRTNYNNNLHVIWAKRSIIRFNHHWYWDLLYCFFSSVGQNKNGRHVTCTDDNIWWKFLFEIESEIPKCTHTSAVTDSHTHTPQKNR